MTNINWISNDRIPVINSRENSLRQIVERQSLNLAIWDIRQDRERIKKRIEDREWQERNAEYAKWIKKIDEEKPLDIPQVTYGDSPDESSKKAESCCYITSACLDDLGIPRTATEMVAIKTLTREHILRSFGGKRDYVLYGRIAPRIVEAIRGRTNAREIWQGVYQALKNVANFVSLGKYEEGHQEYKRMVLGLEAQVTREKI